MHRTAKGMRLSAINNGRGDHDAISDWTAKSVQSELVFVQFASATRCLLEP